MPGQAAQEAIEAGRELFGLLGTQEIIDRLVITGLSALKHRWVPPAFHGRDRDTWRLPTDLQPLGQIDSRTNGPPKGQ